VRRSIALVLLLLAACGTTRSRAEGRRVLVEPGMAGRDVVGRIGRPTKVFPVYRTSDIADQTVEVWAYSKTPAITFGESVDLVVAAGALVAIAVGSKGNDVNGIGGLGSNRGHLTFWIGFGADGRVRGVSTMERTK
jgi:hypothetical protein